MEHCSTLTRRNILCWSCFCGTLAGCLAGAILDRIWSFEKTPGEEAVRTQIRVAAEVESSRAAADLIETVYGIGYRLKPVKVTTVPQASPAETGVWVSSRRWRH